MNKETLYFVYGKTADIKAPDLSDATIAGWTFDGWYASVKNYVTGEYVYR